MTYNSNKFPIKFGAASYDVKYQDIDKFLIILTTSPKTENINDIIELLMLMKDDPSSFQGINILIEDKNIFKQFIKIDQTGSIPNEFYRSLTTKKLPEKKTISLTTCDFIPWFEIISHLRYPDIIEKFYQTCQTNKIIFQIDENAPIPKHLLTSFVDNDHQKNVWSNIEKIRKILPASK